MVNNQRQWACGRDDCKTASCDFPMAEQAVPRQSLGPSLIHWLIVIMTRRKAEHGELHSKFLEPDIRLRDS